MNCCWRAVLMSSSVSRCAKNLHYFRCLQTPQKWFFVWVLDFALTAVISKISTYLLRQTTIDPLPYGQARWTTLPIDFTITIGKMDFHHTQVSKFFFHSLISPTQSKPHFFIIPDCKNSMFLCVRMNLELPKYCQTFSQRFFLLALHHLMFCVNRMWMNLHISPQDFATISLCMNEYQWGILLSLDWLLDWLCC